MPAPTGQFGVVHSRMANSREQNWGKLLLFCVIGVLALLGSICSSEREPSNRPSATSTVDEAGRDRAVAALEREAGVVEVMWKDSSLWVSVPDDGTDRTPLAAQYCTIVRTHTKDSAVITIKDPSATRDLGKYMCSK